jgi:hypothetical protein
VNVHAGEPFADRCDLAPWRDPSHGEHFRRCSYCGSIHPDDLAAETGWHAEWADQKYGWPHKFYVDIANRDPEQLYVTTSSTHPSPGLTAVTDLIPEQEQIMEREGYGPGSKYRPEYVQFGTRPSHYGKFYTIHLSDPDLSAETKNRIEAVSGIRFTFEEGRVAWRPSIGATS